MSLVDLTAGNSELVASKGKMVHPCNSEMVHPEFSEMVYPSFFPLKELRVRGKREHVRKLLASERQKYLDGMGKIRREMESVSHAFGVRSYRRGAMRVTMQIYNTKTDGYTLNLLRWSWYAVGNRETRQSRIHLLSSFVETMQKERKNGNRDYLVQFMNEIRSTDLLDAVSDAEIQRSFLNARMKSCRFIVSTLDHLLDLERFTTEYKNIQMDVSDIFPEAFPK